MTKIVGTLGPNSRSVQVISACLTAGMSGNFCFLFFLWWLLVARFDISWGSPDYHQETLENLKIAVKSTKKLCAVMLDTAGPEVLVTKVFEVKGDDVGCVVKNSATLVGVLFQKTALYRCNMAGKPAVLTRVVDSMTNNLRPTRAVATDVANAVLDGSDAILLGAETLCGLHPVETVSTVSRICAEVICVCMR
ncbi:hypothetical protein IC575_031105 [Cucumis melo]